jgi:hypothetical protein
MKRLIILSVLLTATTVRADQVVLRDGATVKGSYLGGDARTVRIAVGDDVKSYPVNAIRSLNFGVEQSSSAAVNPGSTPSAVVLPAFTNIIVNTIDPLLPGNQTFRATIDSPIYSGQQLVIPKGSPCVLVSVPKPKRAAPWDLVLELQSITINGQKFVVDSDQYAIRTKLKGNVKVPFLLKDPLHLTL